MHSYRMHFESNCDYASDEFITFVTFNQWKILYEADACNWHIKSYLKYDDKDIFNLFENAYIEKTYYDIYYKYPNNKNKHYIKFLRRRDYRKFRRFFKELIKNGKDYYNQKEFLELGEAINKESAKKLEETQKKLNEAYNDTKKLIENFSKIS